VAPAASTSLYVVQGPPEPKRASFREEITHSAAGRGHQASPGSPREAPSRTEHVTAEHGTYSYHFALKLVAKCERLACSWGSREALARVSAFACT
jgi:hypothetical protein